MAQTNKPIHGLNMDTQRAPREAAWQDPEVHSQGEPQRQTFAITDGNDSRVKMVSGFPQESETPPVMDPLTCNTRQVLLQWDFYNSDNTRLRRTKACLGLGPLVTNSLESGHSRTKTAACDFVSGTPAYLTRHQMQAGTLHLPPGGNQRIFHWSQSQAVRTSKKMKGPWFLHRDPQQSLCKEMWARGEQWTHQCLRLTWTKAYGTCILPYGSPSYDKGHKGQQ